MPPSAPADGPALGADVASASAAGLVALDAPAAGSPLGVIGTAALPAFLAAAAAAAAVWGEAALVLGLGSACSGVWMEPSCERAAPTPRAATKPSHIVHQRCT
jgi:hypothetical protein